MRIKRLELSGFKSCMDRTVLEFRERITGVVGPNGCGKSNIVDALRWVLGEQSARHLRGKSMEDVIFAGNDRYGAMGCAEVTLVLDNEEPVQNVCEEDGEVDAELSELVAEVRRIPEIQVTRRLYRSGESEYLINGRPCRLRDITELFLGTGVGTKAYSMIEQGRVGQIVNAKPEELRLFIEEAAGTTLYRSRKVAAERKIERTRDNLLRVSDVLRELERQAGSLRRQAKGAVEYQELKEEEESLDRRLSAFRLRDLQARGTQSARELARLRGAEQALEMLQQRGDAERQRCRQRRDQLSRRREAEQSTLFKAEARVAEVERERRYLEQRLREFEASGSDLAGEIDSLAGRKAEAMAERVRVEGEREQLVGQLEEAAAARVSLDARVNELETRRADCAGEVDTVKAALIDALASQATLRNERAALEREIDATEGRAGRLREESSSLGTIAERLVQEVSESQHGLDRLIEDLGTTAGGKQSAAEQLSAVLSRKAEMERKVDDERARVGELRSRLRSLQELHDDFVGYTDGVRAFMSNGGRERTGATSVLADVLEIESGYERAVAAVLQDRLQYVIVPSADAGVAAVDYLKECGAGRASFIPRDPRHHPAEGAVPPGYSLLSDHLKVQGGFESVIAPLVEGVVVADSLEQAGDQWKRNGYRATFVTREGEVVDEAGVVSGGSGRPLDEGILTRKAEIRALQAELSTAADRCAHVTRQYEAVTEEARAADSALSALDTRLHELTVEKVAAEGELELRRQNLVRTKDRAQVVGLELSGLGEDVDRVRSRHRHVTEQLRVCTGEVAGLGEKQASLDEIGRSLELQWRELGEQVQTVRVQEAELRQKRQNVEQRLQSGLATLADIEARRGQLEARRGREQAERQHCRERLSDPSMDCAVFSAEVERLRAIVEGVHAEEDQIQAQMQALEDRVRETNRRLDKRRSEASKVELRFREVELERQKLREGVTERLGIDEEALLGATEVEDELDVAGITRDLSRLRERLRRLGPVNLGAVSELEEIEKRVAELTAQRDDLESSIEHLRGTIAKLNRLSKDRFRQTFEHTNVIFQETFPKLFRGGKASLKLTDENNLLETGVEIMVQPPGKKLGNLNLLSGGEKAMTAISLIFSLFLHKPSPFCVLDEVDAPLDEANVGRFIHMVREMSGLSQFLLITHSKRTMESCDTLYGVTMPEPGVSRIVSVDLAA